MKFFKNVNTENQGHANKFQIFCPSNLYQINYKITKFCLRSVQEQKKSEALKENL